MQTIAVHLCSAGGGDDDVGPAWPNGTSDYPLALLRSLKIMIQVHFHSAGDRGGWINHA